MVPYRVLPAGMLFVSCLYSVRCSPLRYYHPASVTLPLNLPTLPPWVPLCPPFWFFAAGLCLQRYPAYVAFLYSVAPTFTLLTPSGFPNLKNKTSVGSADFYQHICTATLVLPIYGSTCLPANLLYLPYIPPPAARAFTILLRFLLGFYQHIYTRAL